MTGPVGLDPLLHSGPRISIMMRLVVHDGLGFATLQKSTGLTAGNLASHIAVLAKAGYVVDDVVTNMVARRKTVRLTPAGNQAFRSYVRAVRALLEDAEKSLSADGAA